MPRAPSMTDMKKRLDDIRREIGKLQAQEALLLDMMDEPAAVQPQKRAPKGLVKNRVLGMLQAQAERGLNAAKAVELSKLEGDLLDRGSVSSLLSRLKADGLVVYDGTNYRLKEYAEKRQMPGMVTPLRTSGDSQF